MTCGDGFGDGRSAIFRSIGDGSEASDLEYPIWKHRRPDPAKDLRHLLPGIIARGADSTGN